jgi:hypothetical protein
MKTTMIARTIGIASIAFGIADMLFGKRFAKVVGAQGAGGPLFKGVGVREVATGIAAVAAPNNPLPLWGRFAGDVVDIAALGVVAARPGNSKRNAAIATLGLVAVIAVIDFAAARAVAKAQPA